MDVSVAETESGEGVMGGRRTGLALLEELEAAATDHARDGAGSWCLDVDADGGGYVHLMLRMVQLAHGGPCSSH